MPASGKIIADFIVAEAFPADGGGFLLDCPRALAAGLLERLKFYKLRAKVTVEDLSADLGVMAIWDGAARPPAGLCYRDPRLPELGLRCLLAPDGAEQARIGIGAEPAATADYEAHRIVLGVPSGGADFAYGDAFPHEADMDQLHGVDFDKGCFIGQEVVSRMEHRGIARTRVVPVALAGAVAPGIAVTANGKPVGVMGSSAAGRALAALRLDRVDEALANGAPLLAGEIALRLVKPGWARFAFPGDPKVAP
jgi:folate-binding protein YgfZ